jgi:hypothetical protein
VTLLLATVSTKEHQYLFGGGGGGGGEVASCVYEKLLLCLWFGVDVIC